MGQVTLGQKQGQAQHVVSRCLWDVHTDGWASEVFENESMFCTCQACQVQYFHASAQPGSLREDSAAYNRQLSFYLCAAHHYPSCAFAILSTPLSPATYLPPAQVYALYFE